MRFVAYAVDLNGIALARYKLIAKDPEALSEKPELTWRVTWFWSADNRRVARIIGK